VRLVHAVNALLLLALSGLSLYVYPELPDPIALHFGADGTPDRWGDRTLLSWMLLPLIAAASVGALYAVGWYLPGHPRALNIPDKKKLLELPPPLQAHVVSAAVDMVHITALMLLLMFGSIQYGAWQSAHTGTRSPVLMAGVVFGLVMVPLVTIAYIVVIQRRVDSAWREHPAAAPDLSRRT
jgi:uncharacterized membrane protein